MKKIFLLLSIGLLLFSCGPQENPDPGIVFGSFTDSRDGKVYKTVTIGEQLWMAENLAYLPAVSALATGSKTEPHYYVYGYDGTDVTEAKAYEHTPTGFEYSPGGAPIKSYETYGVLYNWPAAMNGVASSEANPSGVQGACPPGWHLPSDAEWTQLENYLIANGYNYDGTTTGNKIAISLASATGWDAYNNPGAIGNTNTAYDAYRNKSGFSALPGGYRDYDGSTFGRIGNYSSWWSSAEYNADYVWDRTLLYDTRSARWYGSFKDHGFSVRCVRD